MDLKRAAQLFTLKEIRNAAISLAVIVSGLALAGVTLWASQSGNPRVAGILAGTTLVFVLLILLFVVPPLARNAGREAAQMNLPFEFTAGGAIMLGLVAIVGFSAWSTGNNLLFLVLSVLLASLVVGFAAGSLSLRKLDVTMRFPEAIFAGESTPILVKMANRKHLIPAVSTVIDVRGNASETSSAARQLSDILPRWMVDRMSKPAVVRTTLAHLVYLRGRSTVEEKREHHFPRRGRLMIKDFELSTTFPFGFIRHRRRLPAREVDLVVFPRVVEISPKIDLVRDHSGYRPISRRGNGQDLIALREYRPQDDLRRIDWKATARTFRVTVREFAADVERQILVILDPRIAPEDMSSASIRDRIRAEQAGRRIVDSERFEAGVEVTAALVRRFAGTDTEVRLLTVEFDSDFGSGRHHLHAILRHLADIEPVQATDEAPPEFASDLEKVLGAASHSLPFYVTAQPVDSLPPDMIDLLNVVPF